MTLEEHTLNDLAAARLAQLRSHLEGQDVDGVVAASPANVAYATGYRSVAGNLFREHQMAAVVTADTLALVTPAADTAPAVDSGVPPSSLVAYGRFYFESTADHVPARLADEHSDVVTAVAAAVQRTGLSSSRIGVDVTGLGKHWPALRDALGEANLIDLSQFFSRVRSRKLTGEIDLLRQSARIAETGIDRALEAAHPGATERDLARVVASTMVENGARPAFLVVTSGERTALADAEPTDRPVRPGELIRFDVGCVLEGYWSDMARTAVMGRPDPLQVDRYAALLAGEQAQLDHVRPGVTASELFEIAVETVEKEGLAPYRRHHCGHGIGTDVYEPPIVAPGHDVPLEPGMTFCLETPFYELGWGGMMVEDTIVVTDEGHERFTISDRALRVVKS